MTGISSSSNTPPPPRRSHGETTNLSLIDRVRQEDTASWNRFMLIYRPLVSHWCRRAGLSGHDIDDVCQDVFSSVSRSIVRFKKQRRGDTFRGWLRTITRARVADFQRKGASQPYSAGGDDAQRLLSQVSEGDSEHGEDDPDERKASREVFRQALEIVKSSVEPHTWQAFWRTTVDELNSTEVAEELNMTREAVRKAKSRMKIRLRLELGPLLDEITRDAGVSLD